MPQRHSKRSTASSFFTAHERSQTEFGTKRQRLTAEAYREFDACHLCLTRCRDPVCCASKGHIFCRECVVENLLEQRQHLKAMEKKALQEQRVWQKRLATEEEEARRRVVAQFEREQAGIVPSAPEGEPASTATAAARVRSADERDRTVERELERVRDSIRRERESQVFAAKMGGSAFWLPAFTPQGTYEASQGRASPTPKPQTLCPASEKGHPHALSLKGLVAVKFVTDAARLQDNPDSGQPRICPACRKGLSNAVACCLLRTCGHVVCRPCVDKFVLDAERCVACDAPAARNSIIDMAREGTGYAAHKNAVSVLEQVAFRAV